VVLKSAEPMENDIAKLDVEAVFCRAKNIMFESMANSIELERTEQSMVGMLGLLRLILINYRGKAHIAMHFQRSDFRKAKELFYNWFELVQKKIPKKLRVDVLKSAEDEFAEFAKVRWPDGSMDETALNEK